MLDTLHATPIMFYGPLVGNLLLAVVAGGYAVIRRPLPSWFWTVSLVVLAVLAVLMGAGIALFVGGARPRRSLHLMYAGFVAVGGIVQYGLRPGGFLRRRYAGELAKSEARILGLVCLTQFALIARAWMTGVMLAVLILGALPVATAQGQQEATVRIQGDDYGYGAVFSPPTLEVSSGATVIWIDEDSSAHTVTSRDGSFDSGSIAPGGRFSLKFERVGTHEYYCKIHPSMTGKVVVSGR